MEIEIAKSEQNLWCDYGMRLKHIRKAKQVSQMDLEIAANISFGTISRIENGKTNPTKETLLKIASGLSLKKEEILHLFGFGKTL